MNEAADRLMALGQEHLIVDLDALNTKQMECLTTQLRRWTPAFAQEQRTSWFQRAKTCSFAPFVESPLAQAQWTPYNESKSAVILLAGGQGSRLGWNAPKGCFPLLGKSLFERHCEKVGTKCPLAILTSPLNHLETVSFFQSRSFFGLKEVLFVSQGTMPLLDVQGRWFWAAPGNIAEGTDGNGSVFKAFEEAGLLQQFEENGIERIQFVPVDNPLAEPYDPILSSFHLQERADITVKCIRLTDGNEPMGRLVQKNGRLSIVEFAELSEEERHSHLYANTGLLIMDLALMRILAKKIFPLHWVWRTAWKAERFIVDALLYASRGRALSSLREACYAPLKEKQSIAQIECLLTCEKSR